MTPTLQFSISITDDAVVLDAPFSPRNNTAFRSRGGKFAKGEGWKFPNTPATQAMLEELYGPPSPPVLVKVSEAQAECFENEWLIGGYKLAERRGRDNSVQSPDGVQLYHGKWHSSGGSVKNPRVTGENVVLMLSVRHSFAVARGLEFVQPDVIHAASFVPDDLKQAEARTHRLGTPAAELPDVSANSTSLNITLDESERQLILLALAKLSLSRPGWHPACITPLAQRLAGQVLYEEFRTHGPDTVDTFLIEKPTCTAEGISSHHPA